MGFFDLLNKQTTAIKFNNNTLRIAVKEWCESEYHAIKKYGHISQWDTSSVTNMSKLFLNAYDFNSPIGNWDVSNVTTMHAMFDNAYGFNQDISSWDVSNVTDMSEMFSATDNKGLSFNQPIGNWDVSCVTTMEYMFCKAKLFNQPIGDWNVSNVTNMEGMFSYAESFNQPVGDWDVSNVINMKGVFGDAKSFNQPIGNWNVASVINMGRMFINAVTFNQSLENWDVSNVTNMDGIFNGAISFNLEFNWKNSELLNNEDYEIDMALDDLYHSIKNLYGIKINYDLCIEQLRKELIEMTDKYKGELYDYSYWFNVINNRAESHSKSSYGALSNEDINQLSDGHCEEYHYRMIEEDDVQKIEFITPRIISFSLIYDKILSIDNTKFSSEDLEKLEVLKFHSVSSLYGSLKFAHEDIKDGDELITKLYPNYNDVLLKKSKTIIGEEAKSMSVNLLPSDLRSLLNKLFKNFSQDSILNKNTSEYVHLINLIDSALPSDNLNIEIKNFIFSLNTLINSLNVEQNSFLARFFQGLIIYSKHVSYVEFNIIVLELINQLEIDVTSAISEEIDDLLPVIEIKKHLQNNCIMFNEVDYIITKINQNSLKTYEEVFNKIAQEFSIEKISDLLTTKNDELFKIAGNDKNLAKLIILTHLTTTRKYLSDILDAYEENKFYGFDHIDYIYGIYSIISDHLSDQ